MTAATGSTTITTEIAEIVITAMVTTATRTHRDGDRRDGDRRDFREARREDRLNAGRYYAPGGYAYRSWGVGSFFPRDYHDRRYWIGNPFAYRLPSAYRVAQWVRYGPDALLIRLRDGAVLQVIPNRFF